jgi:hypothetical protein
MASSLLACSLTAALHSCLQTNDKAQDLLKAVRDECTARRRTVRRVLWPLMYPGRDDWLRTAFEEAAASIGPDQQNDAVLLRAMAPHARAHHQWFVLSRQAAQMLWSHRASIMQYLQVACAALPAHVPDFGLAADEMLLIALAAWGDLLEAPLSVHKSIDYATTLVSFPPSTPHAAGMARWLLDARHPLPTLQQAGFLELHPDAGRRPLRQPAVITPASADADANADADADIELVRRLADHACRAGIPAVPIRGGFSVYTAAEVVRALASTVRECAVDHADGASVPDVCTAHPITWISATQLYVWVDAEDAAAGVCGSLMALIKRVRTDPVERKKLVFAVRKVAAGVSV